VITVHRAEDRFRTVQPGITTWHGFSSGAHYDPANLSFGAVVACDEHRLDPGAGFEPHAHTRVELVTWVLDGALRHTDAAGRERVVGPGQAQYQLAGTGIVHAERNASDSEALHFVQLWLLTDEDVPDYDLTRPPVNLSTGSFDVRRRCQGEVLAAGPHVHLYVARGRFEAAGHELRPGDSLRAASQVVPVTGAGELLVIRVEV
jgi:hypothetical protein